MSNTDKLTPVPGATPTFDDDGNEKIVIATCGHCGRSWNDAAVSSVTPVPSGRCPFEYEHEYEDETEHYEMPEVTAGTVFDPSDDTFGPIMAAIQAGEFEEAAERLTKLAESK